MKTPLLAAIFTTTMIAATPSIGIVTASGHFTLQGAEVWGNATLFDGAAIETTAASTELSLRNGARVQLGAKSRARVFSDRIVLQAGVGQVAGSATYEVQAAGFKVRGEDASSRIRVGMSQALEVVSLSGTARVSAANNIVLAAIPTGRKMDFAMQAAQNANLTRTGCLLYKDNHFILQDESTQEVVEMNGPDLAANVGNRVEVTGTAASARPAVTIATSVMNVTAVAPRSQGGCLVVASSLDARTDVPRGGATGAAPAAAPKPGAAGGGGGLSSGAKAGIIIAVAGGGGAAAAIALAGGKKSTSQ